MRLIILGTRYPHRVSSPQVQVQGQGSPQGFRYKNIPLIFNGHFEWKHQIVLHYKSFNINSLYYFLTYTLVSYISQYYNLVIFSVNGDNGWNYWTSKNQFWCIYFHHWEIICFTWGKIIKFFRLFLSISYRRISLTAEPIWFSFTM